MTGTILQHRRGTHAEVAAAVQALSEIGYDTTQKRLTVGDGVTAGGSPVAKLADFGDLAPVWCGTAGGTANAITLSPATAPSALAAGLTLRFLVATVNTAAVTVNVSSLGAIALKRGDGTVIGPGVLRVGAMVEAVAVSVSEFRIVEPTSGAMDLGVLDLAGGTGPTTGVTFAASTYAHLDIFLDNLLTTAGAEQTIALQVRDNGSWVTTGVYQRRALTTDGGGPVTAGSTTDTGHVVGVFGATTTAVFSAHTRVSINGTRVTFRTKDFFILSGPSNTMNDVSGYVDVVTAVDGVRLQAIGRNFTLGRMTVRGSRL